jgi:hypothetical protein
MTARVTAGKRLRRTLDKTLAEGTEWTESELVTLAQIQAAADRIAALERVFDAEMNRPSTSAHKVAVLSGEIRQLQAQITKWIASLDPEMEQQKSARHVAAANARWRRRNG